MSDHIEERAAGAISGWLALPVWLLLLAVALWQVFGNIFINNQPPAISGHSEWTWVQQANSPAKPLRQPCWPPQTVQGSFADTSVHSTSMPDTTLRRSMMIVSEP